MDEADVFLQQRSNDDLVRNAMVSIFLQKLEYFRGVLFLTTNRVKEFDEAFRSRIHITLDYKMLTLDARMAVWKLFIGKVKSLDVEVHEPSEDDFRSLAQIEFNGRQVCSSSLLL